MQMKRSGIAEIQPPVSGGDGLKPMVSSCIFRSLIAAEPDNRIFRTALLRQRYHQIQTARFPDSRRQLPAFPSGKERPRRIRGGVWIPRWQSRTESFAFCLRYIREASRENRRIRPEALP